VTDNSPYIVKEIFLSHDECEPDDHIIFHGPQQKLVRADKHYEEPKRVVEKYYETNPITGSHFNEEEGFHGVSFSDGEIPHEISAIVGDVIHNLRSMLDLLVCDMAAMNGKRRTAFFPICKDKKDFPKRLRESKCKYAGDQAVEIIKNLKPYEDGTRELYAIHKLDIMDKHRNLIPRGAVNFRIYDLKESWNPDGSRNLLPDENSRPSKIELHFPKGSGLDGDEILEGLKKLWNGCAIIYLRFYEEVYKKWDRIPDGFFEGKDGICLVGEAGLKPKV
tara:strand:+ start:324 stop:1154 length:831 start_codon:yes stop_codon:yes gene_type:complete